MVVGKMGRRGRKAGRRKEQDLTHIDIDELRNNGNSSGWIRWVDWEKVGYEMTGNFWILGEGELVGELPSYLP